MEVTMSSNLQAEAEQLVRLKLKLGINRYLSAGRGERYLKAVEHNFSAIAPKEVFDSVVEEMEREGLLRKTTGAQHAVILARCTPPIHPGGFPDLAREA
jgi:hypothetical protein